MCHKDTSTKRWRRSENSFRLYHSAAGNAAKAVKRAVEDKKPSTTATDWSTLSATPSIFDCKSEEEEAEEDVKTFREWSRVFEK